MNEILSLSQKVTLSVPSSTVLIADKAKKLKEKGADVIDFSAGRAFEPTPKYIIERATQAMLSGDTHQTMAKGTTLYRQACAQKLARENNIIANPETEIVATMGIKQGLTISLLSIINPGDEVLVEDPCFVSYKQLITYLGGTPIPVPLKPENGFRWQKGDLDSYITPKTKALIFNSPHNPTGVVHTHEDLEVIAEVAQKHRLFVIADEVYERTTWGNREHLNLANLSGMRDFTITLMSLTKSFSMGGWRIGFAHAPERLVKEMEKLQQHLITSVNSFVQAGAALAFGEAPRQEVLDYWKVWEEKCQYFTHELNQIPGLHCKMPEGGFYAWVDISKLGISSEDFAHNLLEQEKVAVIPGASFGIVGNPYIRITCVKTYEDIQEGLKRIQHFVKSLA